MLRAALGRLGGASPLSHRPRPHLPAALSRTKARIAGSRGVRRPIPGRMRHPAPPPLVFVATVTAYMAVSGKTRR
ncbi:hypothetical protein E2C01_077652 [Portunus trituberculatus]|uniref:Uncharacterized protein n=1 Tax=Portunus trituberculatus TaxID=210409 RepID=A0A5B7IKR7_PORTR|nr:hypothetical protein [Portunus trituberculatus]